MNKKEINGWKQFIVELSYLYFAWILILSKVVNGEPFSSINSFDLILLVVIGWIIIKQYKLVKLI